MFNNKLSVSLLVVSVLMLSGCLIKGRVIDQNGAGIAGVTVNLSGAASMTNTTDFKGEYQFGTVNGMLSAGSYTVTPSGNSAPIIYCG